MNNDHLSTRSTNFGIPKLVVIQRFDPSYLIDEVDDLAEVLDLSEELLHGAVVVLVDGDRILVVIAKVGL